MGLARSAPVAVLAFACACISAGGSSLADAIVEDRAPRYTNADLARLFGPAPSGEEAPCPPQQEGSELLERFLARQYAQIEAEREARLRRLRLEAEAASRGDDRWRGGYAVVSHDILRAGVGRAVIGGGLFHPRPADDRPRSRPDGDGGRFPLISPLHGRPGSSIVPIHARP